VAKPKKEITSGDYGQAVDFLFQIFQKLEADPPTWKNFLQDILTHSEIRMIKRRWHIASLLEQGQSVRQAAAEAKVGTDTVMRVWQRIKRGTGGLQKALSFLPRKEKPKSSRTLRKVRVGGISRWVWGGEKE
jgi:uncharacterized protein YerC